MAAEGAATAMPLFRRHNRQEGPLESDRPWSASMLHRRRRGARAARGSGVDDKVRAAFIYICSENLCVFSENSCVRSEICCV
jgi:hypothetical protein